MFNLFWVPNSIKIKRIAILRPNLPKILISGQDPQLLNNIKLICMINELDLLWMTNFIALGIYFIFGTKCSWNERIDTCLNVECVLFGHNFDFLGIYLVVTARYLVVTGCYCSLASIIYWWLLLATGGCGSLSLVTARSHF